MNSDGQIKFGFSYRITQFMCLVVDDLEMMEVEALRDVAVWMMNKIRGRVCPFSARFSIDEEDEVEVQDITVGFLFDLLRTCQKRGIIERVDFEMESEPRTTCWKQHYYKEEKKEVPEAAKENRLLDSSDIDFDVDFLEFLQKLEERQQKIKESALRLLSTPKPCVLSERNRLEKSVQTSAKLSSLPAEVFVPELPSPDLSEFHDAQVDLGGVDHFVDALFDLESKSQNGSNSILKRFNYTSSRMLPSKQMCWPQDLVNTWEKTKKVALPWTLRSIQQVNSLRELDTASIVEDLITSDDTNARNQRMQKKWDRLHGEAGLSMTAALSTGVGGLEENTEETQIGKKNKARENEETNYTAVVANRSRRVVCVSTTCGAIDLPPMHFHQSAEWMVALLKMLEQKPAKSRKLLKGLINFSKEHKSSKSSKPRHGDVCRHNVTPSKNSDSETPKEESGVEFNPVPLKNSTSTVDVYEYMKMKLKEHEKAIKENAIKEKLAEPKTKTAKKTKNHGDIRSYLVGKKIVEPSCKACGAQADIRDFLVGKKARRPENVSPQEVEPSTVTQESQKDHAKSSKNKHSSKNRIRGKYVKLCKVPTLAVVGETSTRFLGRLSNTTLAYGKTFKLTNISRKELHMNVTPMNWLKCTKLVQPISPVTLAPGQTKDVAVTITEVNRGVLSQCHLLSIVQRRAVLSPILTFKVDVLAEHLEGPLLSDLYTPEEVKMITMFVPIPDLPRPLAAATDAEQHSDEAETTETVHTVVNMLKDEVDSLCTAYYPNPKVKESSVCAVVQLSQDIPEKAELKELSQTENSSSGEIVSTCENKPQEVDVGGFSEDSLLIDSTHTAVEDDIEECIIAMQDVDVAEDEADDSDSSDFEFVDVDEGGSISSDKED